MLSLLLRLPLVLLRFLVLSPLNPIPVLLVTQTLITRIPVKWDKSWAGSPIAPYLIICLGHLSVTSLSRSHDSSHHRRGLDEGNIRAFCELWHFLIQLHHFRWFLHFSFEYPCCWDEVQEDFACDSDMLPQVSSGCLYLGTYSLQGSSTSVVKADLRLSYHPMHPTPFPSWDSWE